VISAITLCGAQARGQHPPKNIRLVRVRTRQKTSALSMFSFGSNFSPLHRRGSTVVLFIALTPPCRALLRVSMSFKLIFVLDFARQSTPILPPPAYDHAGAQAASRPSLHDHANLLARRENNTSSRLRQRVSPPGVTLLPAL